MKLALMTVTVSLALAIQLQAAPKHVLFLGNSFTYHGSDQDVPTAFHNIAVSAGYEAPVVWYNAPGSYTLYDHLNDATSLALIATGGWDFVVLQEQSVWPACYGSGAYPMAWFDEDVTNLYDLVKSSSPTAKVVLYETWAWTESRIAQGNVYCNASGDIPDAATMQALISSAYHTCASDVIASGRPDVLVANVGDAQEVSRTYSNSFNYRNGGLFSDASHHNRQGTYLSALVIFSTIYSNTPVGSFDTYGLSSSDATYLQNIARYQAAIPQPNPPWPVRAKLGDGQLALVWSNSARTTSYTLRRATTSGGPYTNIAVGLTSVVFTNTGLNDGTSYYYVVGATNSFGAAPDSFEISATPGPDLQLYLPVNENTGTTANDFSTYARTGTLNGGASWTTGISGSAVNLDGTSGYVSLPAGAVSALNDFTVAAWVYPSTLTSWQRVFDFGSGTQTYMMLTTRNGSGVPRFAITTASGNGENGINAPSALTAGVWTHMAVTLSNKTGILYINGTGVATNNNMWVTPFALGSTTQNWIGRSQYADPYFNGRIDDFRIYDRALSRAEILSITNAPSALATGFQQTGAGPYDYNTTNNWVSGTINGIWHVALTLAANQEVTFAADTSLGTGLTFNYTGSFPLTLDATGANHTLTLGGDIATAAAGNVTIGNSSPGQNLNVNLGGVTRTINVAANTLTLANAVSNGGITKTGAGTLTLAGNNSYASRTLVSGGTLSLTGSNTSGGNMIVGNSSGTAFLNLANGSALTTAELTIGDNDTGYSGSPTALNGTAFMRGGTVVANNWFILGRQAGVGTFNQTGGSVTNPSTATGFVALGWHYSTAGGTGNYTLSSNAVLVANSALNVSVIGATSLDIGESSGDTGSLTLSNNAQVTAANRVLLGHNSGATGTLAINDNAALTMTGANGGLMVWSGTGNILVNGGALSANWLTLGQNSGASGTVTQTGGTVSLTTLWTTFLGAGTYNLNGGTLVVGAFSKGSGTGTLSFNGGTLSASGNWTLSSANINTAQIRNNGAILNSAGNSVTISQPLVHSTIAGDNATDGGLTKVGTGTLTLSGTNTFTGNTIISNGTLAITGSITNSPLIAVAGGATLDVHTGGITIVAGQTLSGNGSVTGTVTIANGATLSPGGSAGTLTINGSLVLNNTAQLQYDLGSAGNDRTIVNGSLTLTGTVNVAASGTFGAGDYTLITYTGALTGTGLAIGTVPNGSLTYSIIAGAGSVVLHVVNSGPAPGSYEAFAAHYSPSGGPNADPFGTGMSNTNKFLAGFDPTNPNAYLHIISETQSGSDMVIAYLGASGDQSYAGGPLSRTNVLEIATGTGTGSFTNNFTGLQTNVLSGGNGAGLVTNMVDSGGATNVPARYYRVRVLAP